MCTRRAKEHSTLIIWYVFLKGAQERKENRANPGKKELRDETVLRDLEGPREMKVWLETKALLADQEVKATREIQEI